MELVGADDRLDGDDQQQLAVCIQRPDASPRWILLAIDAPVPCRRPSEYPSAPLGTLGEASAHGWVSTGRNEVASILSRFYVGHHDAVRSCIEYLLDDPIGPLIAVKGNSDN